MLTPLFTGVHEYLRASLKRKDPLMHPVEENTDSMSLNR